MITLPPPREDELVADALEVFFDIDGGKFTYDLVDIAIAHVQRENKELGIGVQRVGISCRCNSLEHFSTHRSRSVL